MKDLKCPASSLLPNDNRQALDAIRSHHRVFLSICRTSPLCLDDMTSLAKNSGAQWIIIAQDDLSWHFGPTMGQEQWPVMDTHSLEFNGIYL